MPVKPRRSVNTSPIRYLHDSLALEEDITSTRLFTSLDINNFHFLSSGSRTYPQQELSNNHFRFLTSKQIYFT